MLPQSPRWWRRAAVWRPPFVGAGSSDAQRRGARRAVGRTEKPPITRRPPRRERTHRRDHRPAVMPAHQDCRHGACPTMELFFVVDLLFAVHAITTSSTFDEDTASPVLPLPRSRRSHSVVPMADAPAATRPSGATRVRAGFDVVVAASLLACTARGAGPPDGRDVLLVVREVRGEHATADSRRCHRFVAVGRPPLPPQSPRRHLSAPQCRCQVRGGRALRLRRLRPGN